MIAAKAVYSSMMGLAVMNCDKGKEGLMVAVVLLPEMQAKLVANAIIRACAELDTDEAVVKAAIPDAELYGGHHGKVWIQSATCNDSYTTNGMISQVMYLGTSEKRRLDAWKDARTNSPTVQAYEAGQEAKR